MVPIKIGELKVDTGVVQACSGASGQPASQVFVELVYVVETIARMMSRMSQRDSYVVTIRYPGTKVPVKFSVHNRCHYLRKEGAPFTVRAAVKFNGRLKSFSAERVATIAEDHMLGVTTVDGIAENIKVSPAAKAVLKALKERSSGR